MTASDGAAGDHFGAAVALTGDGNSALIGANYRHSQAGAAYSFARSGGTWSQQVELTASDGAASDYYGSAVALSAVGGILLIGAWGNGGNTGAAYVSAPAGPLELTASDGVAGDQFGWAVALSADGSTALIGADERASAAGAAYVFARSGSSWSQQAELTAGDGVAGDQFGSAVALSANGNTALIGAPGRASATGAAYMFVRSGSVWSQQAELTAGDGVASDNFGHAVALSDDGSTALIGAYFKDRGAGAAYAFVRSGSVWSQQQELTGADTASGDFFGRAVALSADGNTALVGAYGRNNGAGAAYAFTRSGSVWSQQQELAARDGAANDHFGFALTLAADGNTALVGAYNRAGGAGAAYVFVRGGGALSPPGTVTPPWSQQAELTALDGAAGDHFGAAVALSADGATVLVGANYNAGQFGTAYAFTRVSNWIQQQEIFANDGATGDSFGAAVALSADGTALIGAWGKNGSIGAAYVVTLPAYAQLQTITASDGAAGDYFGGSAALSADGNTALVGAPEKMVGDNASQGAAYVFARSGDTWSQQAELTAADGASGDSFGTSLALSADGTPLSLVPISTTRALGWPMFSPVAAASGASRPNWPRATALPTTTSASG